MVNNPKKLVWIEVGTCSECPFCQLGREKGLPSGTHYCHQVYDDRPNWQGRYRRVSEPKQGVPDWCPLPNLPQQQMIVTDEVGDLINQLDPELRPRLERDLIEVVQRSRQTSWPQEE